MAELETSEVFPPGSSVGLVLAAATHRDAALSVERVNGAGEDTGRWLLLLGKLVRAGECCQTGKEGRCWLAWNERVRTECGTDPLGD